MVLERVSIQINEKLLQIQSHCRAKCQSVKYQQNAQCTYHAHALENTKSHTSAVTQSCCRSTHGLARAGRTFPPISGQLTAIILKS